MPIPAPIVLPALDKVVDVVVGGLERAGEAALNSAGAAVTIGLGYLISPGTSNVCTCSTDQPMPGQGPPPSTSQQGAVNTDPINSSRSTLPRGPGGEYLPHPEAQGAHSTLGTRIGSDGKPYRQGATFDANGRFTGRTDVSNHGRGDHVNPHLHPATGPASVRPGPGEPIPQD